MIGQFLKAYYIYCYHLRLRLRYCRPAFKRAVFEIKHSNLNLFVVSERTIQASESPRKEATMGTESDVAIGSLLAACT